MITELITIISFHYTVFAQKTRFHRFPYLEFILFFYDNHEFYPVYYHFKSKQKNYPLKAFIFVLKVFDFFLLKNNGQLEELTLFSKIKTLMLFELFLK